MTGTNGPAFTGTPDEWWEQAERITEAEAAERVLGTWYIVAEKRSANQGSAYRLMTPTYASNEPRKIALRRAVAHGELRETDIAPRVRALVRVQIETPEWLTADLVMADAEIGSDERILWRRTPTKWIQVFNAKQSASERTMLQLHPAIATVTEEPTP